MSRSPSRSPPPKRSPKSTPFLCRIFTKAGAYHSIDLFQEVHTLPLSDEYAVYAWKTSTLSTLLASLYPSLPVSLQNPGCKYSFRTIYFDARATLTHDDRDRDRERERNRDGGDAKPRAWRYRELGRIDGRDLIRGCGEIEGAKTLEDLRYVPGNYLCLSIHPPPSFPAPHDSPAFHDQTTGQNQQPQQPMMRINPRASFGNAPAAGAGESWIDARNSSQAQPRFGGGGPGGFGIRGRGAVASKETNGNGNGWPNSSSGNGNGKAEDDGWGARPVSRRRSASPMRGTEGNSGW